MEDTNTRLLALARRVAAVFTADARARASVVVGSVARRQSDRYSDIDLCIYYDTVPTDAELAAGRDALGATNWLRLPGGTLDGLVDIFSVDGVECQLMHTTVARIEGDLNAVLTEYGTEHEKHAVVGGLLDALALFDDTLVADWQARAAAYPDALAEAMVRDHLRFWPHQMLVKRIVPRDAPLFFHKALMDNEKTLLSALSGLNRVYPQLEFKRLGAYVARMSIAPADLAARLKQILCAEPLTAVAMLRDLIRETFDLIDQHMPAVDTTEARQRFERAPRGLDGEP